MSAIHAEESDLHKWQVALVAHIRQFMKYPAEARADDEQGVVRVIFTINHEGLLQSSKVVQSSGHPLLDQEVLDMLARAQPMPRPPENTPDSALSFVLPVRYNIK